MPKKTNRRKTSKAPRRRPPATTKRAAEAATPEAVDQILAGVSTAELVAWLANTHPAAAPADVLQGVSDYFDQAANADPAVVVGFALEATRLLYQRMIRDEDYAGALKAIKQLVDLCQ